MNENDPAELIKQLIIAIRENGDTLCSTLEDLKDEIKNVRGEIARVERQLDR